MNMQDELSLIPPQVFHEELWGAKLLERLAELRGQRAVVETMTVSKRGNAAWVIQYRFPDAEKNS